MSEIKREQLLMAVIAGRGPAYLRGLNLSSMDLANAGWLVEADLRFADLSNANLRRSNLRRANLEGVNLHAANLLGANLEEAVLLRVRANVANFNIARLRGANLKGMSLVGASMVRADLEEADFDGADLEGADLEGSNLRRARLTNTNLKMTNLEGADLTDAIIDSKAEKPSKDSPPGGFQGTISSVKLPDLIQICCLSRADIELVVSSSTEKGSIFIGSGRVLHALAGEIQGEEALTRILGWENGRFVARDRVHSGTVSVNKPVEQILIEAVRLNDERRYNGKYSHFLRKLRDSMPVEARASSDLIEFLGPEAGKIHPADRIRITDVFEPGDSEEILCSLSARDEMFIAPLKFALDATHPLFGDLEQLQSG